MTNNTGEVLDDRDQDQKNAFNQLVDDSLDALNDFIKIQTMAYTLFQHEAKRLGHQLGKEHPQVKTLEENSKRRLTVIRGLRLELETARIDTPDMPKQGVLVHGRVVDASGRGISELSVFGEDEEGRRLRAFGSAETNPSGYYAIKVEKDTLQKLQKIPIYLAVSAPIGKIIHREEKPLKLKPDNRFTVNITLDRKILRTKEKPIKPPKKTGGQKSKKGGEAEGSEEGGIDIGKLKGIGPKTADRLRKAGIKDIATFMEKNDAELQAVMGKINIDKIRKDNADLLRKIKGK